MCSLQPAAHVLSAQRAYRADSATNHTAQQGITAKKSSSDSESWARRQRDYMKAWEKDMGCSRGCWQFYVLHDVVCTPWHLPLRTSTHKLPITAFHRERRTNKWRAHLRGSGGTKESYGKRKTNFEQVGGSFGLSHWKFQRNMHTAYMELLHDYVCHASAHARRERLRIRECDSGMAFPCSSFERAAHVRSARRACYIYSNSVTRHTAQRDVTAKKYSRDNDSKQGGWRISWERETRTVQEGEMAWQWCFKSFVPPGTYDCD